jgi:hypothetical protein
MQEGDKLTIVLYVALIAFAVLIVDERMLRGLIALVPALLLAQRAASVGAGSAEEKIPQEILDRRKDDKTRQHVDQLLKEFREFYSTCHLMSVEEISMDAAKERAAAIELRLNRLLAQVMEDARERASE